MKQLIAALVLCAFLVTVGIGCGGSTPSGGKTGTTDKEKDKTKDTKPPGG